MMATIAETQAMKSKALQKLIKGLDTDDIATKLKYIELLGKTVALGVKVDTEQDAISALDKELQSKKWRIRRAAKKAIDNIKSTKRSTNSLLEMFDGGVGFTTKK